MLTRTCCTITINTFYQTPDTVTVDQISAYFIVIYIATIIQLGYAVISSKIRVTNTTDTPAFRLQLFYSSSTYCIPFIEKRL